MPSKHASTREHRIAQEALNTQKVCKVSSCTHRRYRLAGHCHKHAARQIRWGDSRFGRAWSAKTIQRYEKTAQGFIDRNWEHPAIVAGLKFLDDALAHPPRITGRIPSRLAVAINDLANSGITGEQVLVRSVAVILYALEWRREELHPDVLKANLGVYVLRAADLKGVARHQRQHRGKELGHHLFQRLGKLFVGVVTHIDKLNREREALEQQLSTPFE